MNDRANEIGFERRLSSVFVSCVAASLASTSTAASAAAIDIVGDAVQFAHGIASTEFSEVRLTLSPDGNTALWFSRDRPGGAGGYDIWMSRRVANAWSRAVPVSFNSSTRDFDPAFSPDGAYVYFCSDTYGPMLDWSSPNRFTFAAQRGGSQSMDLYWVRYELRIEATH